MYVLVYEYRLIEIDGILILSLFGSNHTLDVTVAVIRHMDKWMALLYLCLIVFKILSLFSIL
jgi:hypothetical protein